MTNEVWIEVKRTNQIPMELFYEFYQIHNQKDTIMTPTEFRNNFQLYVYDIQTVPVKKLIGYYDQKLGITKLFDKFGKLIKEY